MNSARDLAARREILVSQCELDRLELALAWHDLRRSVRIGGDTVTGGRAHGWIGRTLGLVLPLLGATRARRLSRYLSIALLAYRIATGLRGRG
jgi:hypothetical protein